MGGQADCQARGSMTNRIAQWHKSRWFDERMSKWMSSWVTELSDDRIGGQDGGKLSRQHAHGSDGRMI